MNRTVQRMSYPDAAMKLAEADAKVARYQRELDRAVADRDQAMANVLNALWMLINGEEPPK